MSGAATFGGNLLTGKYRPTVWVQSQLLSQQGKLFTWWDCERMRQDPNIMFGLGTLTAPLGQAKFEYRSKDPRVKAFVERQLKRIWRRDLDKISSMFEFGAAGGEVAYKLHGKIWEVDGLLHRHIVDLRPMLRAGKLTRLDVLSGADGGDVPLPSPRWWWISHRPRFGSIFGQSRLRAAWEPWQEKRGTKGAVDCRRTWYFKNAYRGGTMRHPLGDLDLGDGMTRSCQEYAREILEKFETGGIMVLPNMMDEKNNYLWVFEPPATHGDVKDIREYSKDLDLEMLQAMGIPPEVVQAAETGSGWAGRTVPFLVFLSGLDQAVNEITEALDRQIIWHLVRVNFGPAARYEIEPKSLVPQDPQQGQPSPGAGGPEQAGGGLGGGGQPGGPPGGGPPGGGPPGAAGGPQLPAGLMKGLGMPSFGGGPKVQRHGSGHQHFTGTDKHNHHWVNGKQVKAHRFSSEDIASHWYKPGEDNVRANLEREALDNIVATSESLAEVIHRGASLLGIETGETFRLSADGSPRFGSTQFDLPDDLAGRVLQLAAQIDPADLVGDGVENSPHITCRWGLHPEVTHECVRTACAGRGPVKVKLGPISVFPAAEATAQRGGDQFDVVKIAVESPDLHALHHAIGDACAHTGTHPEYQPHVTLGYCTPGTGNRYVGGHALEGQEFVLPTLTYSPASGAPTQIPLSEIDRAARLSVDAHGHEHAGKGEHGGEFVNKGKPKKADKATPPTAHGERLNSLAAKHAELREQMRLLRHEAHGSLKADADKALKAAAKQSKPLQKHLDSIAWPSESPPEPEETGNAATDAAARAAYESLPDGEAYDLFGSLESQIRSLPGGHDDEDLTPGEQFERLGEIIDTAKQMQAVEWPDDVESGVPAKDAADNKKQLAGIIAKAKEARQHLRTHSKHRKEMGAIRRGEYTERVERLAAEVPGLAEAIRLSNEDAQHHLHKGKGSPDGGQFTSKGDTGSGTGTSPAAKPAPNAWWHDAAKAAGKGEPEPAAAPPRTSKFATVAEADSWADRHVPTEGGAAPEEALSADWYRHQGDGVINGQLRAKGLLNWLLGPRGRARKAVKHLDSLIGRSKLAAPATVFRGMTVAGGGSKKFKVGDSFSDPGYWSTSLADSVSRGFMRTMDADKSSVLFHIELPAGHNAYHMPRQQGKYEEAELLLPRGSRFTVHSVEEKPAGPENHGRPYTVVVLKPVGSAK